MSSSRSITSATLFRASRRLVELAMGDSPTVAGLLISISERPSVPKRSSNNFATECTSFMKTSCCA